MRKDELGIEARLLFVILCRQFRLCCNILQLGLFTLVCFFLLSPFLRVLRVLRGETLDLRGRTLILGSR